MTNGGGNAAKQRQRDGGTHAAETRPNDRGSNRFVFKWRKTRMTSVPN